MLCATLDQKRSASILSMEFDINIVTNITSPATLLAALFELLLHPDPQYISLLYETFSDVTTCNTTDILYSFSKGSE